jgi:hypothetical protein
VSQDQVEMFEKKELELEPGVWTRSRFSQRGRPMWGLTLEEYTSQTTFRQSRQIEGVLAFLPPKTVTYQATRQSKIFNLGRLCLRCELAGHTKQSGHSLRKETIFTRRDSPNKAIRAGSPETTSEEMIGCLTELDFEYMGWRRDWQQQQCDCCYMLEIVLWEACTLGRSGWGWRW